MEKKIVPVAEAAPGREDAPYRAVNHLGNWWIMDEHEVCMGMSPRKEWAEMLAKGMNLLAAAAVRYEHLAHDDEIWASDEVEYEPGKWDMVGAKWMGEKWKAGMKRMRRKVPAESLRKGTSTHA